MIHEEVVGNRNVVQVDLGEGSSDSDPFGHLFAEELGLVLEASPENEQQVLQAYTQAGLMPRVIGSVTQEPHITISVQGTHYISGKRAHPCT